MKKGRTIIIMAVVLAIGMTSVMADWWVEGVGSSAQHLSGFSRFGPYPTREAAEAANRQYCNGEGTVTELDSTAGSGSATSPGNDALSQSSAKLGNSLYQLGYGFGQWLVGNPQNAARQRAEAERAAQLAREREQQRLAEEARRKQQEALEKEEQYKRLSSVLKLDKPAELAPKGFDGDSGGLVMKDVDSALSLEPKLGDSSDNGLHPKGTSFFGTGGGTGGNVSVEPNNDAKVVDLRSLHDIGKQRHEAGALDRVRQMRWFLFETAVMRDGTILPRSEM